MVYLRVPYHYMQKGQRYEFVWFNLTTFTQSLYEYFPNYIRICKKFYWDMKYFWSKLLGPLSKSIIFPLNILTNITCCIEQVSFSTINQQQMLIVLIISPPIRLFKWNCLIIAKKTQTKIRQPQRIGNNSKFERGNNVYNTQSYSYIHTYEHW